MPFCIYFGFRHIPLPDPLNDEWQDNLHFLFISKVSTTNKGKTNLEVSLPKSIAMYFEYDSYIKY
jgi:hypothetical protein